MNALALAATNTQDITPQEPNALEKLKGWIDAINIADDLDSETLSNLGERAFKEYNIDDDSRADWKQKTKDAMDLALQVAQAKSFPWPKASNVIWPLVTTAALQFNARAYPAVINGRNVVRGMVVGSDDGTPAMDPFTGQPRVQTMPDGTGMPVWAVAPGEKQMRADRIGEHMSWQLLDEMPEWEPETDRLLVILPIVGVCIRKSYFDTALGRNISTLVNPMKWVVNFKAKSMETAPRQTEEIEFYPHEIEEHFRSGLWKRPATPFGIAQDSNEDDDAPHVFLEQHRRYDLDEDGYAEPIIVTLHRDSRQIVRIIAGYDEEGIKVNQKGDIAKIDPVAYYTRYEFIPNPDSAIYSLGFGQLLRPINEAINTTLNQMLDAGTLQNTGGGFIGKGLSMNAGAIRFQLGEYKTVNVTGGTLKENIVPMAWPGPSKVLFELLGMLVESGKEIAAIKDVLTGEQQQGNVPATTTLALIEQGLKVFTAIYKRVHRGLKAEFTKLYRLNRIYGQAQADYQVGDTWKSVTQQDYQLGSGVQPVSDPTMVSDMQKMGRANFLLTFANDPYCDGKIIRMRAFKAADIEKPEEIVRDAPPNPELAIKGMELEIKGQDVQAATELKKAQSVAAYASAIKSLADADAVVGAQHLQWLDQHLRVWEREHDAATQPTKGADGTTKPGGPGPSAPALPHPMMPAPSNNVQPDISTADNMQGGVPGDPDGNHRMDPDSQFAADHSGQQ